MSRGRQASVEVRRHVARLALEGFGATPIHRELERQGWFGGYSVSLKTVQRMVRDVTPADPSGPWSLADADPEEARLVLDVGAEVFNFSTGRRWLTKDHAAEVARVRVAAPDIPPLWAYAIARAYELCAAQGRDARYLDFALGLRPWESAARFYNFTWVFKFREPFQAQVLDPNEPNEPRQTPKPHEMAEALAALVAFTGSLADLRERLMVRVLPALLPYIPRNPDGSINRELDMAETAVLDRNAPADLTAKVTAEPLDDGGQPETDGHE